MDRTTEPVVAVLGSPIAGNASQFAMLRAFEAMRIDWRVLSFNVVPNQLHVALDGLHVLGFEGVLIDENLSTAVQLWAESLAWAPPNSHPCSLAFDCLSRSPSCTDNQTDLRWAGHHAASDWLSERISAHFASRGRTLDRWTILGHAKHPWLACVDLSVVPCDVSPSEPEQLEGMDVVIVASECKWLAETIRKQGLPLSDTSTLIVDLANHLPHEHLSERGYRLIDVDDIRAGMLQRCIKLWTHQQPSYDILREAIEEFTAM